MENQDNLLKTLNGLKKYQELLSELIKIIEPKSKELPIRSSIPLPPSPPNDRIIREDGKGLVNPNIRKK